MGDKRAYHAPRGNPCPCGVPISGHRVGHSHKRDKNDDCSLCGLREYQHKVKPYIRKTTRVIRPKNLLGVEYIGIDGEGYDEDSDHRYALLCASSNRRSWHVEPTGRRLTTVECLDFILSLPCDKYSKIFAFSFNYDITKMLTDVDDATLYRLFRPELRNPDMLGIRKRSKFSGPIPVVWNGYRLNLQGTKFTVQRGDKKVVVWDLFKFYQSKFVDAIKKWRVGNADTQKQISKMKDQRGWFSKFFREGKKQEVLDYCFAECRYIGELASKLVDAHKRTGLKLHSFYGAGSSGAAMLTAMGIKDQIVPVPEEMRNAVASAFFGGRFENSVVGKITGVVYDYDISSAYPYQLYFLPCLVHGHWRRVDKRIDANGYRHALVRYKLGNPSPRKRRWGPFPFRADDGSIAFPSSSGGGWVWLNEYLAGEKMFPNVQFVEAWVLDVNCDCRPFERIAKYYRERCAIGKDGPGYVLKLGCNSCYGKLAQSVGNAVFNNWIWAGMITSGTRAQILDTIALHRDWSNLLTIATDGIKSLEQLSLPSPEDTGTYDVVDDGKPKPLGGWEEKISHRGLFVARPGVYFPLDGDGADEEALRDIKGRGVGRSVILENRTRIIQAWRKDGIRAVAEVANVKRFCGGKTSISLSAENGYRRASGSDGTAPSYGQWIQRKVQMTFDPMPKRDGVARDGRTLLLRSFPQDLESAPYDRAKHMFSKDAKALREFDDEMQEQPDKDYSLEGFDV